MLRDLLICVGVVIGAFAAVVFIVMRSLKMKEYYDKLLSLNKESDSEDEP